MAARILTIPSTDTAFRKFIQRTLGKTNPGSPEAFERRLRLTYPRVIVRERGLAGEMPAWYVYRDGAWQAADGEAWWDDPSTPHVTIDAEGWIVDSNATARGLLGAEALHVEPRHFTDFTMPGATEDAVELFNIVRATGALEATVVLQPTTGHAIAADLRATPHGDGMAAAFRLATGIDLVPGAERTAPPERVEYAPRTDVAFRAYAERALGRMPEPTPEGLALRLRRLYPHADVEATANGWQVRRDPGRGAAVVDQWWLDDSLPRVRYDGLALILEANEAATAFFGRTMVGHHWQEFVTAGSTDEVGVMLEILAEAGAAESRFRMPRGDGSLLEFDSYTVADGQEFLTIFRPVPARV